MPPRASSGTIPRWIELYDHALSQAGYFTSQQAAEHHINTRLLSHHVKIGRLQRALRGVFRFRQFSPQPNDELVPFWLWTAREGLFSHETALSLRGLSDVLPVALSMTLPTSWRRRRLRVPRGLVLHFSDVSELDRSWVGPVPVTGLVRTLNDCSEAGLEEQFLRQAVREAIAEGQLIQGDLPRLRPELHALVSGPSAELRS